MVEYSCSIVEQYASAIEMAFAANIALALWATLGNRFRQQKAEFSEAADALERNEKFQETIGLRRFRSTLRWGLGVALVLWVCGLVIGLVAAVFLYHIMWHDYLCPLIAKSTLLLWAAYTFPSIVVAMTLFGLLGSNLAAKRMQELKGLEFKTSEEYKTAVQILQHHQQQDSD